MPNAVQDVPPAASTIRLNRRAVYGWVANCGSVNIALKWRKLNPISHSSDQLAGPTSPAALTLNVSHPTFTLEDFPKDHSERRERKEWDMRTLDFHASLRAWKLLRIPN